MLGVQAKFSSRTDVDDFVILLNAVDVMDFRNSIIWQILNASIVEWILLVLSVSVLFWLIIRVKTWFREDEDVDEDNHEMLLQFRDLRREGELTDQEYRSIKSQLTERDTTDTVSQPSEETPTQ